MRTTARARCDTRRDREGALIALLDGSPAGDAAAMDRAALDLIRRWIERMVERGRARGRGAVARSERVRHLLWACESFDGASHAWKHEELAAAEREASRWVVPLADAVAEDDRDGRMAKLLRQAI